MDITKTNFYRGLSYYEQSLIDKAITAPSAGYYHWTLAINPMEVAYLSIPRRTVTEREWEFIMKFMELLKEPLTHHEEIQVAPLGKGDSQ